MHIYLVLVSDNVYISQQSVKKMITPNNVQSAMLWGGTAAATAIWMTQPFDYIKSLFEKQEGDQ